MATCSLLLVMNEKQPDEAAPHGLTTAYALETLLKEIEEEMDRHESTARFQVLPSLSPKNGTVIHSWPTIFLSVVQASLLVVAAAFLGGKHAIFLAFEALIIIVLNCYNLTVIIKEQVSCPRRETSNYIFNLKNET